MTENAYRDAGVDIDLEATAIKALINNLSFKRKGNYTMLGNVGHFAGLIDFGPMALALTTDGVGTKMLVADKLQDWSTVGIDCIAMNVNDLYVMNVEPIAFVDYIATDKLSVEKMAQIGLGLNEGAKQANIDIVGGETASLRGLVNGLDLAGTCLGMQKKDRIITGDKIRPGDKIIGVPSTGVHSNGLSLARNIVEKYADYDQKLQGGEDARPGTLNPDPDLPREPECRRHLHGAWDVPRHRRWTSELFEAQQVRVPVRQPAHSPGDLPVDTGDREYLARSRCTGRSTWAWGMPMWCRQNLLTR